MSRSKILILNMLESSFCLSNPTKGHYSDRSNHQISFIVHYLISDVSFSVVTLRPLKARGVKPRSPRRSTLFLSLDLEGSRFVSTAVLVSFCETTLRWVRVSSGESEFRFRCNGWDESNLWRIRLDNGLFSKQLDSRSLGIKNWHCTY